MPASLFSRAAAAAALRRAASPSNLFGQALPVSKGAPLRPLAVLFTTSTPIDDCAAVAAGASWCGPSPPAGAIGIVAHASPHEIGWVLREHEGAAGPLKGLFRVASLDTPSTTPLQVVGWIVSAEEGAAGSGTASGNASSYPMEGAAGSGIASGSASSYLMEGAAGSGIASGSASSYLMEGAAGSGIASGSASSYLKENPNSFGLRSVNSSGRRHASNWAWTPWEQRPTPESPLGIEEVVKFVKELKGTKEDEEKLKRVFFDKFYAGKTIDPGTVDMKLDLLLHKVSENVEMAKEIKEEKKWRTVFISNIVGWLFGKF